jgi:hypothetical protein
MALAADEYEITHDRKNQIINVKDFLKLNNIF